MPKRVPTPPPADDEPRYLTVVFPYPLYADMEREPDRIAFVYWMASCIGRDNLLALFHKPRSSNMVIIEVPRRYPGFSTVLGEHRWSEFLRQPSDEEKTKVSKVFYCTYRSGREVEKYGRRRKGWKRIFILDSFYETPQKKPKWLRINDIIKYPYPKTYRCEVPPEDKTREPLCRPLPVETFPRPPPVRPPTVGTPEWAKAKEAEALVSAKVKLPKNAWSAGAPASLKSAQSAKAKGEQSEQPGVSLGVINMSGWARGPNGPTLPPGLLSPPVLSRSNTGASIPGSTSSGSSSSSGGAHRPPPGLSRLRGKEVSPALTGSSGASSTSSSGGNASCATPIEPEPAGGQRGLGRNPMADDLYGEDESDGSGPTESSVDFILEPDASESDDEEFEVPFHTPGPLGTEMERRTSWDDVEDTSEAQTQDHNHRGGGDVEPASTDTDTNLWGDNQTEAEPAKEWECPTHGARCSRGLCTEYGKYKAGKNRAEREKERANNAGKHGKKAKQQSGRDGSGSDGPWRTGSSKGHSPATGANNIAVRPKPDRFMNRDAGREAASSLARETSTTGSSGPSTIEAPTMPDRLKNGRQGSALSDTEPSRGGKSIPSRLMRLDRKGESATSNNRTSKSSSAASGVPPMPPHLMRQSSTTAPSEKPPNPPPQSSTIPPRPQRLNSGPAKNANKTSTPAEIPQMPARLVSKPTRDAPTKAEWLEENGEHVSGRKTPTQAAPNGNGPRGSADPWDLDYRPSLKMNVADADVQSIAASTTGGWDNVSEGPWGGGNTVKKDKAAKKGKAIEKGKAVKKNGGEQPKRSWADEMEEEDARPAAETDEEDAHSVAETDGWGSASKGPW
ncbi:predicted protein [Postia placenta Mad-698-R]|nr:predicted protein [Postia placenta Mad-698-R]